MLDNKKSPMWILIFLICTNVYAGEFDKILVGDRLDYDYAWEIAPKFASGLKEGQEAVVVKKGEDWVELEAYEEEEKEITPEEFYRRA